VSHGSIGRSGDSATVPPAVDNCRREENLYDNAMGTSRYDDRQRRTSESDGGSDWGRENPSTRNGQRRKFSSSKRRGRHHGDSSDDDSDRSASPSTRRQAVPDRRGRCSERRLRSPRREERQQSKVEMRQEVSQAREADSSVQYTGTPRARFGFTVGAKLGTYDGSACLETFIARFNNCARYFKWDEEDKLFQLCASLSGPAGQILWDTGTQTTADEVMRLLRNRFASINQAERFCAELRARKRKPGESLQKLYQDICRLMFLAYPGPTSELSNNVARDAFLEALDNSSLRVRILKKEPVNLDDALKLACRLEAFDKSASQEATNASTDARRDKKFLKAASGGNYQQTSAGDRQWLDDMKQLQDSLHECCSQVTQCRQELEAMKQSQIQPPVPPVAVGWTPVGSAFQSPLSMSYDASGASQVPQHPVEQAGGKTGTACHRCGQEGHWARSCPLGRDQKSGRWGKTSQPSGEQADKPKIQPLSYIKGKADVYLPVNLFGRKALVLLDTGCDTSVIGRNLLPTDVEIRTLFAANKMEITLLNEVHTVFSVAGQEYSADVVVTEAIKKLILGIDWLASKACRWDFEHARLGLGDRWVCLQSRPRRSQVRRIYAEESMAVPAWSQVDFCRYESRGRVYVRQKTA